MSELPPPSPSEKAADLAPPEEFQFQNSDELSQLGSIEQTNLDSNTFAIGSLVLGTEVELDDTDRTLTREEIDSLKSLPDVEDVVNQEGVQTANAVDSFKDLMIGDRKLVDVQAKVISNADYFVDKYNSLSSGPNGFTEALDKLGSIRKQLFEYDIRDPENNRFFQETIDDSERLVNYLMEQEEFVPNETDKSLAEGQPLSSLRDNIGRVLENVSDTEEPSDSDAEFQTVGHAVIGSLQELVSNSDVMRQNSPSIRAEINRLFNSVRSKTSTRDFDPRDIEYISSFISEITRNVEQQKAQADKMASVSNEFVLNVVDIFKLVGVRTEEK